MQKQKNWIPILLFFCCFGIFNWAAIFVDNNDRDLRIAKARTVAQQLGLSLEVFAEDRRRAIANLMLTWPTFSPNATDWFNASALSIKTTVPGLNDILWVSGDKTIKWSIDNTRRTELLGQSLDVLGIDLSPNAEQFQSSIVSQNGQFYLLFGRVISPQEPELGYVIGSFDLVTSLSVLVGELIGPQFNFTIHDDELLLFSGGQIVEDGSPIQQQISFAGRDWMLTMQSEITTTVSATWIKTIGLFVSACLAAFLGLQLKQSNALAVSEARYKSASKAALDAILIYRKQGDDFMLAEFNSVSQNLFRQNMENLKGIELSTQLAGFTDAVLYSEVVEVFNSGKPFEQYLAVPSKVFNAEWIKLQIVRTDDGVALTLRDVSERFKAKQALEESEKKYRHLVNGLHNHFVYTKDLKHNFEYLSEGVETVLGYSPDEFIALQQDLLVGVEDDVLAQRLRITLGEQAETYTLGYKRKDGERVYIEFTDSPVLDGNGTLDHIEGIARNVTQEFSLKQKIEFQANHDELTGLANRYAFDRRLAEVIQELHLSKQPSVLCFVDMDRFKLVNDTCGHAAGDLLLRKIANLFAAHCNSADALARVGGDEFCFIFRRTSLDTVKKKLTILLDDIAKFRFEYDGQMFFVGASIGVVEINQVEVSASDYTVTADNACYEAKRLGRNRFCVYRVNDDSHAKAKSELDIVGVIQNALEDNRFELYCQGIHPIVSEQALHHFEVLLRLRSPANPRELISPAQFIPIAEKNGLMHKIDYWVVSNTINALLSNRDFYDSVGKCAINLSGVTLANEQSQRSIVNLLSKQHLDYSKLCFEITETAAVTNISSAKHFIQQLRDMGCSISLDDFGAGMSSFTYLKNLPVDYVKIDGAFVRNMHEDPIDFATVKAIHTIATSMGKQTIAEFVGDEAIVFALRSLGVNYGQGFALSEPQPLTNIIGEQ